MFSVAAASEIVTSSPVHFLRARRNFQCGLDIIEDIFVHRDLLCGHGSRHGLERSQHRLDLLVWFCTFSGRTAARRLGGFLLLRELHEQHTDLFPGVDGRVRDFELLIAVETKGEPAHPV